MKAFGHFVVGIVFVLWTSRSLHAQSSPLTNTVVGAFDLSAFTVDGQQNPSLILLRGVTYVFQIDESSLPIHPFYIKTAFTNGGATAVYTSGVTGNGSTSGNLVFVVPSDAPNKLYYHCGNHFPMGGTLNIINGGPVPSGLIILIALTETNVTMQSLGASNWTAIPEFTSNLTVNAWATVPNYTNSFANGTNTTLFNRIDLDPICGSSVFLRVRNQSQ